MSDDNVVPFPGNDPQDLDEFARQLIEQHGSAQALLAQLGVMGGFGGFGTMGGGDPFGAFSRPRPKLLRRRRTKVTYVVRVDLDDAKPPIWRRLRLASDLNLARLHDVLQIAMGWTNSHLHQFKMGPASKDFQMMPFLTDYDVEFEGATDGIHERDVQLDQVLAEPGQRLFYEYDFGDGWEHTIKLEKVEPWVEDAPDAVCTSGRRSCPPEDVGGIHGYEEALAALRGEPGDNPEWTQQILTWMPPDFDPEHFDADAVNDALEDGPLDLGRWHPRLAGLLARGGAQFSPIAAMVGEATTAQVDLSDDELDAATLRYRHLLTMIGDGVNLTQAGYLPPALVKQLYGDLDMRDEAPWGGSREDKTWPVLYLRETATAMGLLRKQHGKLLPTASGRRLLDNPRQLFAHLRDRLPLGRRDFEQDAGMLALIYAAAGEDFYAEREHAAEAFASLGWVSEGPLQSALWWASEPTRKALDHLGASGSPEHRTRIARALLSR